MRAVSAARMRPDLPFRGGLRQIFFLQRKCRATATERVFEHRASAARARPCGEECRVSREQARQFIVSHGIGHRLRAQRPPYLPIGRRLRAPAHFPSRASNLICRRVGPRSQGDTDRRRRAVLLQPLEGERGLVQGAEVLHKERPVVCVEAVRRLRVDQLAPDRADTAPAGRSAVDRPRRSRESMQLRTCVELQDLGKRQLAKGGCAPVSDRAYRDRRPAPFGVARRRRTVAGAARPAVDEATQPGAASAFGAQQRDDDRPASSVCGSVPVRGCVVGVRFSYRGENRHT